MTNRKKRATAIFLLCIFLNQWFFPFYSYALTGGPSQPEVESFQAVDTNNMVDLFSGDFNYNIPLLDVDGYPVNISYSSAVTMDQEASWVGLGWNLNPGVINRTLRGLPDEFKGDTITKEMNMRPNKSFGITGGVGLELVGFPIGLGFGGGIVYNNYKGFGLTSSVKANLSMGSSTKCEEKGKTEIDTSKAKLEFSLESNSLEGTSVGYGIELSKKCKDANGTHLSGCGIGQQVNSVRGMEDLTFSFNHSKPDINDKEKNNSSSSYNQSGSISFANKTYSPTIDFPYNNFSVSFHATLGTELFATHPKFNFDGFYSVQKLETKKITMHGYGYQFSELEKGDDEGLMDINRENDITFRKTTPVLPITNFTYDLFNVSGDGIGGQYRMYRSEAGIVNDRFEMNTNASVSFGLEIGPGAGAHVGADVGATLVLSSIRKWNNQNRLKDKAYFTSINNEPDFENSFFKQVGETTPADVDFYNKIKGDNLIQVPLYSPNIMPGAEKAFKTYSDNATFLDNTGISDPLLRTQRAKRTQPLTVLNAAEAQKFALDKFIVSYPLNTVLHDGCNYSVVLDRSARDSRPLHHPSEITVTKDDGRRYIYGIPAYNNVQKECSFAVDHNNYNASTGLVSYTPGSENSTGNNMKPDCFYSSNQTPAYAHSFLLTAVVSADYVDLTSNGISDDDLGDFVKFNYSRVHSGYRWRVPFEQSAANYQDNSKSGDNDDRGNYVYGEKEIWQLNSIESRNYLAQFIISPRQDAYGVLDENGGIDTLMKNYKLDEIRLYSKSDYINHPGAAIPIKTVHFVYKYDLCNNLPNNRSGNGKLTLSKVYFTFADNTHGALNSYQFNYGFNPDYNMKRYDRWGNYKNNSSVSIGIDNSDFPYTIQQRDSTDKWASSWLLNKINLPSGGSIKINYEADDYAYVQDKRAAQMILIKGFGADPEMLSANLSDKLYSKTLLDYKANNCIYFVLPVAVNSQEEFKERYIGDLQQLYYKVMVTLNHGKKEFIPGYADIDSYGYKDSLGWIKIKGPASCKSKYNPVTVAALQYMRLSRTELIHPPINDEASIGDVLKAVFAMFIDLKSMLQGFIASSLEYGWCKDVDLGQSWIRIDNPQFAKLGGGVRVKEIRNNDNWDNMITGQSFTEYGLHYDYTDSINTSFGKIAISSGVASYEPSIGGEENALKNALFYQEKIKLAPDNDYYITSPVGECFYPAPSVGYSKVTVSSINNDVNFKASSTGKIVNEFYTTKAFPTFSNYTPIEPGKFSPKKILSLFNIKIIDVTAASQGIKVDLNNMNGKPFRTTVLDANDAVITRETTFYKEGISANGKRVIANNIDVLNKGGKITQTIAGEDIDAVMDLRENNTECFGVKISMNNDFFMLGPFPITLPAFFPNPSYSKDLFRTAVAVKVINRTGIVDRVIKEVNGSKITTKNLLYDSETGMPVLTQTQNEFDSLIYDYKTPAFWAFKNMGPLYKSSGIIVKNITVSNGVVSNWLGQGNYLRPGDELCCFAAKGTSPFSGNYEPTPSYIKLWAANIGGTLKIIDDAGKLFNSSDVNPATGFVYLKVIRPSYRNILNQFAEAITTMRNPIKATNDSLIISNNTRVLNATATEFSDKWKIDCGKIEKDSCMDTIPSCDCFKDLLEKMITNKDSFFNLKYTDGVTLKKLLQGTPCSDFWFHQADSDMIVYTLQGPVGNDQFNHIQIAMGECTMDIYAKGEGGRSNAFISVDSLVKVGTKITNSPYSTCAYNIERQGSADPKIIAFAVVKCHYCDEFCVSKINTNEVLNPYKLGIMGNWHPYKDYIYYSDRNVSGGINRIQQNGYYADFNRYWAYNNSLDSLYAANTNVNWVNKNTITSVNRKGVETENKDALDIYSSALFGYNQSLPIAVAKNGKLKEVANENFEDYGYNNTCGQTCTDSHFSFGDKSNTTNIVHDAHTGINAILVGAGNNVEFNSDISYLSDTPLVYTSTGKYTLAYGCNEHFNPDSNKYLVSVWVKEANSCDEWMTTYEDGTLTVTLTDNSAHTSTSTFHASGPIIDGWQRIEGSFTLPGNTHSIQIKLSSNSLENTFDDFRIHPLKGNMKSFVYHPVTLKLMAELDENNYATFYEYNDAGKLIRVKKETERGIMTVKESRSEQVKQ